MCFINLTVNRLTRAHRNLAPMSPWALIAPQPHPGLYLSHPFRLSDLFHLFHLSRLSHLCHLSDLFRLSQLCHLPDLSRLFLPSRLSPLSPGRTIRATASRMCHVITHNYMWNIAINKRHWPQQTLGLASLNPNFPMGDVMIHQLCQRSDGPLHMYQHFLFEGRKVTTTW